MREEPGGEEECYQQQRRVNAIAGVGVGVGVASQVLRGTQGNAGDAARSSAPGKKLNTFNQLSVDDIEFLVVSLIMHWMPHRKRRRMRPLP